MIKNFFNLAFIINYKLLKSPHFSGARGAGLQSKTDAGKCDDSAAVLTSEPPAYLRFLESVAGEGVEDFSSNRVFCAAEVLRFRLHLVGMHEFRERLFTALAALLQ